MLVAFPIAFYTAAFAAYLAYNGNQDPFWFKLALVANGAGVTTALLSAVPGFIDWVNIPGEVPAKRTGFIHLMVHVLALTLFIVCFLMEVNKWDDAQPVLGAAIALTATGVVFTLIGGFLGWTLVQKHHVGIDELKEQPRPASGKPSYGPTI